MPEPRQLRDRRPESIPADWLTRQKAQAALNLRSPTALIKLLDKLAPNETEFRIVGQVGYLSPPLVDRLKFELAEIEDIRDLPGYMPATTAHVEVGCSYAKFCDLVNEYPPSVRQREVVKARNNNSEVSLVFSPAYVNSLFRVYEPRRRNSAEFRSTRPHTEPIEGSDARSHGIKEEIFRRIESAPVPNLIDPDRAERDQLLGKVQAALDRLNNVPNVARDRGFTQLMSQLRQVVVELNGSQPMPKGVERLLDQAKKYLRIDND